jgi:decaprenyl-phosphate phosphoribosyltransferase
MTTTVRAARTARPVGGRIAPWVRAVRPRQWIKNVTVLGAPAAAGVLDRPEVLARTLAAAAVFVVASAGVYLLNDVRDVDADRLHPDKVSRPVASGQISTRAATAVGAVLCLAAIGSAVPLGVQLVAVVAVYVTMTVLYSWRLKHVAVLELFIVASGFVLRAIGGGVVNHLPLSRWFLLVSGAGALFLVSAKRQAELRALAGAAVDHRSAIGEYTAEWLQQTTTVALGATVVGYCLWAFQYLGHDVVQVLLAVSVVPFVAAMLRYTLLVSRGLGQSPERHLLSDRFLLGSTLSCGLLLVLGLYAG